jgi:acyl carrier protein
LVAHIEEKLNIELDAERAKNIQTVDDLVHLVFDKLNGLLDED